PRATSTASFAAMLVEPCQVSHAPADAEFGAAVQCRCGRGHGATKRTVKSGRSTTSFQSHERKSQRSLPCASTTQPKFAAPLAQPCTLAVTSNDCVPLTATEPAVSASTASSASLPSCTPPPSAFHVDASLHATFMRWSSPPSALAEPLPSVVSVSVARSI